MSIRFDNDIFQCRVLQFLFSLIFTIKFLKNFFRFYISTLLHVSILGSYSVYSPFHKTLPKSSLRMHWISVRFYEMGDI